MSLGAFVSTVTASAALPLLAWISLGFSADAFSHVPSAALPSTQANLVSRTSDHRHRPRLGPSDDPVSVPRGVSRSLAPLPMPRPPTALLDGLDGGDFDPEAGGEGGKEEEPTTFDPAVSRKDGSTGKKRRASTARVGGRAIAPRPAPTKKKTESGVGAFFRLALPILAALALLKSIFGGLLGGGTTTSDPSFVYYQKSSYESTYYGPNGKAETTRKESFRSNAPSLISGEKERGGQSREGWSITSSSVLEDFPDEEFEREIDAAVRRSMADLDRFF